MPRITKQTKENLRIYITNNYDPSNYDLDDCRDFSCIAKNILETFRSEKRYSLCYSEFDKFEDWCQGLPSILDTCYYYIRSAFDDLSYLFPDNEREIKKLPEESAQRLLTRIIYYALKEAEND